MELVGDFQLEEVVDGEEVEHPAVHPGFKEGVLVLRQANIVQPAGHPLKMIFRWNKGTFSLISPDGPVVPRGRQFPVVLPEEQDKLSSGALGSGFQALTRALDLLTRPAGPRLSPTCAPRCCTCIGQACPARHK